MLRTAVLSLVVLLVAVSCLWAGPVDHMMGVGLTGGWYQPGGGDQDYEGSGFAVGLTLTKPATESLWFAFDYRYAPVTAKEVELARADALGVGRGSDTFKTKYQHAEASAMWRFSPEKSVVPFISGGLGVSFWQVEDWSGNYIDEGAVPEGYNTDGKLSTLSGTNFTGVLGLGVEFFASQSLGFTLGGKFRYLFDQSVDSAGWSSVYGKDYVDANSYSMEAYVAVSWYFGGGDCDGDGIYGRADKCWRDPEDFDGFEDEDGCPDPDNDGDGFLDIHDKCPDEAEDFDGDMDDDGCPDVDMDGDGILDMNDKCPREPEDIDGYMDDDGCPDPDNDGDGVPDARDKCPNTQAGVEVGPDGCPLPKVELVAVMINFAYDSDTITPVAAEKLDAVVKMMNEADQIMVEVAGHASSEGSDAYNMKLSERRATAVRDYLVGAGIGESRVMVTAFGSAIPLVPNDNEDGRSENRRAVITPVK
jgi:outer membrane protein OmpA-like peptidoglycan-associated protein